jgi:hypothetical protein
MTLGRRWNDIVLSWIATTEYSISKLYLLSLNRPPLVSGIERN